MTGVPEGHTVVQRTLTGWRSVLPGTSQSSARTCGKSPSGEEQPQGTNICWGYPGAKQLKRKGVGDPGGAKLNMRQQRALWQRRSVVPWDALRRVLPACPSSLLSTSEVSPGVMCPVLVTKMIKCREHLLCENLP